MRKTYAKIFALLTPGEKRRFFALFAMVLVVGLLEVAGVASILPFLAVIADPTAIETNQMLARAYALSGAEAPRQFLILLGMGVFCVVVFGLLFKALTFNMLFRFTSDRVCSLSTRLMHGYLGQDYAWFLSRNSADLGKKMLSDVERVVTVVLIPAMRFMAQSIVVASLVALLVIVRPVVAISAALLLGAGYALVFWFAKRGVAFHGVEQVAANAARYRIVSEAFGGVKDVKTKGLERAYLERFAEPARKMAHAEAFILTLAEMPRHLLEAIAFGGMLLLVLALLGRDAGGDGLRDILPLLGLYAFAGIRLFPASQQLYANYAKLRFGGAVLDVVFRDLEAVAEQERRPLPEIAAPMGLERCLELRGVRFRYPGAEQDALDGMSLAIEAKTTVGIVGGTGAGKTTAIDVILGLLTPDEGTLVVDGVEISEANRRSWRRSIGYVPQQIYLTDDTVAANIAFGVPLEKVDMAAVERAAQIAELHEFVMSELPQGYGTIVGERGVRLSGGQRQRIGIARSLYDDPAVLVLDEATSALDNITERAVMDAVRNLGHRKTIVMIAHRLTTVRECDMIFLLEGGRVVASGRYDALLRDSERFSSLAAADRSVSA